MEERKNERKNEKKKRMGEKEENAPKKSKVRTNEKLRETRQSYTE